MASRRVISRHMEQLVHMTTRVLSTSHGGGDHGDDHMTVNTIRSSHYYTHSLAYPYNLSKTTKCFKPGLLPLPPFILLCLWLYLLSVFPSSAKLLKKLRAEKCCKKVHIVRVKYLDERAENIIIIAALSLQSLTHSLSRFCLHHSYGCCLSVSLKNIWKHVPEEQYVSVYMVIIMAALEKGRGNNEREREWRRA